MQASGQLGEFLRSRRSRLSPEEAGVVTYGGRRRVPGLRREELALLAGVSASYYARLEQGLATNASPEVLDALSRALRLDDAERRHLSGLAAGGRRPVARRPPPERVDPTVRQLVAALGDVPVLVLGRRLDVLAWNVAGHALFAGHLEPAAVDRPDRRPNMARLIFLDAHTRDLYVDWPAKARAVVATLRATSGQHPADPLLAALVGELAVRSPEFAAAWADHRVKAGGHAGYEMRHPVVGVLAVTQQTLRTEDDQVLVVATTAPGSPSQAAMTLLVHTAVTGRAADRQPLPAPG
ncbi:helix-turn-helix transcriptional regulator [Micromonospora sp. NPDC048894]|uniref:helix-turn-helix domain-containing protein n=1 Tax=unclassified Micromonospora TaxID=2617518 RepID=UPI0033E11B82